MFIWTRGRGQFDSTMYKSSQHIKGNILELKRWLRSLQKHMFTGRYEWGDVVCTPFIAAHK